MRFGRHCEGRQHKARRIDERTRDDGFTIAYLFRQSAENRLANAPCKILDSNGERKLGAHPIEFCRNRDLEHTKGGADREIHKNDDAADD